MTTWTESDMTVLRMNEQIPQIPAGSQPGTNKNVSVLLGG